MVVFGAVDTAILVFTVYRDFLMFIATSFTSIRMIAAMITVKASHN